MTDAPLHAALRAHPDRPTALIEAGADDALHGLVARFLPTTPDAAAQLAGQVVDYLVQKRAIGEDAAIDAAFVARVLSIHAGLARALVDPGDGPEPAAIADALARQGCPPDAAHALAGALAAWRTRPVPHPGPLLAVEIAGDDPLGRRGILRGLASWVLGSSLRVVRAHADRVPMLDDDARATLAARPLQLVRIEDPHGAPAVRAALATGRLGDLDLRGALVVRVGPTPLTDPPAPAVRLVLRGPSHGLRLVHGGATLPPPPAPPAVDAVLVSLHPVDGPAFARDHLAAMYRAWAAFHGHTVAILAEPLSPDDDALLRIEGDGVHGMLRGETGVHRVRHDGRTGLVRVRVGPARGPTRPVAVRDVRALKATGLWGGRIRSRIACDGGLVLQNDRSISDNRHAAIELSDAFHRLPPPADGTVRRIDLDAPHVHDAGTEWTSHDPEALAPPGLDALLRLRRDGGHGPDGGVA